MMRELFNKVQSQFVTGQTYRAIFDVFLPSQNIPFREGHIPQFSLVGIDTPPDPGAQTNLVKVSPIHGRAYELNIGPTDSIFFEDKFGNIFMKLNTKGNNLSEQQVYRSELPPCGFKFMGLQTNDSIHRIAKVSEFLRSYNIDTEIILKVTEPQELPVGDQMMSLADYKKFVVQNIQDINAAESYTDPKNGDTTLIPADIPDLTKALNEHTFLFTVRGQQVSERLADLTFRRARSETDEMVKHAFTYVNFEEQVKAWRDPTHVPDHFSIDEEEEIGRYFYLYLPKRAAQNFARMHKLGLVHRYPHTGQISLVGSFYDLDGVWGEPLGLGDPKVTMEDIIRDAQEFIHGHANWPAPHKILGDLFEGTEHLFAFTFLTNYVKEMGWEGEIESFKHIVTLTKIITNFSSHMLLDHYIQKIVEKNKITFEYPIGIEEFTRFAFAKIPQKGGKIPDYKDTEESEEHKQLVSFHVRILDDVTDNMKEHFQKNPLAYQISEKDLSIFIDHYVFNILNKLNISFAGTERTEEEVEKLQRDYLPLRSEAMRKFEIYYYQNLIFDWGWEEDVAGSWDKIKKLFEDNGFKFEGEITKRYTELQDFQKQERAIAEYLFD